MLLDTHSLLWTLDGGARFGPRTLWRLEHETDLLYSAISLAEIRIKHMLGKLTVPDDLRSRIEQAGIRPVAYDIDAADALLRWPSLVRHDPFDRLLLTQAAGANVSLLTADSVLLALPDAPVLDARN